MRVVVSGTHGSGKSTLISDFAAAHREWQVHPDPFELMDAATDEPGAEVFYQQLRVSASRLLAPEAGHAILERGPLDFLAYLDTLDVLGRAGAAADYFELGVQLTHRAIAQVDLLVLLPLNRADAMFIGEEEDLELRDAMNTSLLELADDPDLVDGARVIEIAGDRELRLALLESGVHALSSGELLL